MAYIESNKVDKRGLLDKRGEYVRIENFWIHPEQQGKHLLQALVRLINKHPVYEFCHTVYWVEIRDENGNKIIDDSYTNPSVKKIRQYDREKLVNKILGDSKCLKNCLV